MSVCNTKELYTVFMVFIHTHSSESPCFCGCPSGHFIFALKWHIKYDGSAYKKVIPGLKFWISVLRYIFVWNMNTFPHCLFNRHIKRYTKMDVNHVEVCRSPVSTHFSQLKFKRQINTESVTSDIKILKTIKRTMAPDFRKLDVTTDFMKLQEGRTIKISSF